MTKLEDLIHSLITLIVRYHDSQPSVKKIIPESDPLQAKKKSRKHAIQLFQESNIDLVNHLDELNKKSTQGYTGRKPFLDFIVHEILFLKKIHHQTKSLEPKHLEEGVQQLTQLFKDLKKLLCISKTNKCLINYSYLSDTQNNYEKTLNLSGLMNDAHIGSKLCNSGHLLKEDVLERLNIITTSSNEELALIAQNILTEHQNTLLVPELQTNYQLIKQKYDSDKENYDSLNLQLQQAQSEIVRNVVKMQQLEKALAEQSKKSSDYKLTITQLEKTIAEQSEEINSYKEAMIKLEKQHSARPSSVENEASINEASISEESTKKTVSRSSSYSLFFGDDKVNRSPLDELMPFLGITSLDDRDSYHYYRFRE